MTDTITGTMTTPPRVSTLRNELPGDLEHWLGASPHLVVKGSIGGRELDVEILSETAAQRIRAKRQYLRQGGHLAYYSFELWVNFTRADGGGEPCAILLDFENADFSTCQVPGELSIQTSPHPDGPLSTLAVDLMIGDGADRITADPNGWFGHMQRLRDSGAPGPDGALHEGEISGYVSASRGADWLVVSYTCPVAETEVEDQRALPSMLGAV